MHRGSSVRVPTRIQILNWMLIALAVAGLAGALLTGCDRTISDNGSLLSERVR